MEIYGGFREGDEVPRRDSGKVERNLMTLSKNLILGTEVS